MTGIFQPRTIAWAVLWFLVVVAFTAAVGIIATASSDGEMPPLAPGLQDVRGDEPPEGPSHGPLPEAVRG